jgi:hypothetical protein
MSSDDYESEIESLSAKETWHSAVALRAYRLWQREGRPEGVGPDGRTWADHFWLRSESQMRENGFG